MNESTSAALRTALAYYEAWTGHDFDRAMTFIADDIVCDAPAGQIVGAEAFRAFMGPFSQLVTASSIIAALGDDETALLMYDTATRPVPNAPGAEHLTVVDGAITHITIIFDRQPFTEARQRAGS
ncbi:nuclear transport factor 2 family protein [Angustibacter luteus]|uniref:Nuclear transport factor 2 family protein n=1 Tax=Angustibacter luteus TaxID=658456 RepID=A0ABW1JDZ4_9ACTN